MLADLEGQFGVGEIGHTGFNLRMRFPRFTILPVSCPVQQTTENVSFRLPYEPSNPKLLRSRAWGHGCQGMEKLLAAHPKFGWG
jgi:hypothetical protein